MEQSEAVIEKIKKLLELASSERNPSAHEAESAMAKVQELLAKYELDLTTVEQSAKPQAEEFVTNPYGEPFERTPMEHRFAAWIVQSYFQVSVFTSTGYSLHNLGKGKIMIRRIFETSEDPRFGRRVCFLGRKTNVTIAEYVYGYLCAEFRRQWERYHNETGSGNRLDYYRGLRVGLDRRLEQERKVITSDRPKSGTDLMNRKEAELDSYVHSVFPSVSHSGHRSRGIQDSASLAHGTKAGGKLNIHPAVNQARGTNALPPKT
jgi:hypothetical protein